MRIFYFMLIAAAPAAHAGWKARVAATDITPKESVWMAGYAARTKPSEAVLHKIHAKALAIEDGGGSKFVIVTLDLVGITRAASDAAAAEIKIKHGIERGRIAFNASHTHSAPVVTKPDAYTEMKPEHRGAVDRYNKVLHAKLVAVIGEAIGSLEPAQLSFEQGFAGFAVNRRRVGHREYPGPVDHDVPVMALRAADGRLRAVLFGYACHNTVLAGYEINGDYAGYAQEELERMNPGAIAMFVEGCGADANPLPRRTVELAQLYGKVLANAADQVLKAKMKPLDGPMRTAFSDVEIAFQPPPTRAELQRRIDGKDAAARPHAQRMLALLDRDGKLRETYTYPVQGVQFGPGLTMLLLGGEVVVDYALRFKSKYGPDSTWVAGYSNDVFGYVPSVRVLKEGGYEGGGAMLFTSLPGPFADSVEGAIAARVDWTVNEIRPIANR